MLSALTGRYFNEYVVYPFYDWCVIHKVDWMLQINY